jgi:dihydroorotase
VSTTQIHSARLVDPASGLDAPGGVVIRDGVIADVGVHLDAPQPGVEFQVDAGGLVLAPGLIDLRVKTGEPGEESRETLATASRAALRGGITTMVVMPDTQPVLDDVALIEFIHRRGEMTGVNRIRVAGALTRGLKGEAMAELGLMREAGAAFFTQADAPIPHSGVLKRAMSYAASMGAPVFLKPDDAGLSGRGVMNAGAVAARKGLSGIPREAEWIGAARDIILAQTTGARLVIDQASTAHTLELVREGRARGADVHVSVAAHHLFFNEHDVGNYLTYCKVSPPFRGEEDRQALIDAYAKGEIAAVVSAHDPQPPETKRLPFAEAEFGAAGLETLLAAVLALVHDGRLSLLQALRPLTVGPAVLAGLPGGRLEVRAPADMILIDAGTPWLCQREDLISRSVNSPFDGRRLQGKVRAAWVGGVMHARL